MGRITEHDWRLGSGLMACSEQNVFPGRERLLDCGGRDSGPIRGTADPPATPLWIAMECGGKGGTTVPPATPLWL